MNSERETLITNSKSPQLSKLNNRQRERETEREREYRCMKTRGIIFTVSISVLSLSTIHARLIHNWLDDDGNCIIVTIGHKCSPVDSSNCFPRVLGICTDRPMSAGENSLPSKPRQRCVCPLEYFVSTGMFSKKKYFY